MRLTQLSAFYSKNQFGSCDSCDNALRATGGIWFTTFVVTNRPGVVYYRDHGFKRAIPAYAVLSTHDVPKSDRISTIILPGS